MTRRMIRLVQAAAGLTLALSWAGCAPARPPDASVSANVPDTSEGPPADRQQGSLFATLTECAGALAARAGLDPATLTAPEGEDTPDKNLYWVMLALADKEVGVADGADGAAARASAAEARARFVAGTEAERDKVIADCRARFAPF